MFATLDPWPAGSVTKSVAISSILDALPRPHRLGLLDAIVGQVHLSLAMELLIRWGESPEPGKGGAILKVIDSAVTAISAPFTRPQARALALCIPLDVIQQRLEILAKLPELSSPAEEFATTLEFRLSMRNHFYQP